METVTAAEWAAGRISDQNKLERIVAVFRRDGVAVVDNCIPDNVLDEMAARLDHDAAHQIVRHLSSGPDGRQSQLGHLACGLPRNAPWVFPVSSGSLAGLSRLVSNAAAFGVAAPSHAAPPAQEIVANPIIEQIVVACLDGAAFIRYYNGNCSLPGSTVQGIHMDGARRRTERLSARYQPEIHRVDPESGSTLKALIGILSQTAASTCEF
jgi:hypothetical protein